MLRCAPYSLTSPTLSFPAGLTSQVAEIQALSLDTSARLVKAAGPELVRPHLPQLVPAMLESLRCALRMLCLLGLQRMLGQAHARCDLHAARCALCMPGWAFAAPPTMG